MLLLVRGIPGSGKSTFVKRNYPQFLHLENDMFHIDDEGHYCFDRRRQDEAVKWCLDMAELALSRGVSVVVSNTFTKRKYLKPYIDLAERYGHEHAVVRIDTYYGNVHDVPKEVVESMKRGFEDYEGETVVSKSDTVPPPNPCWLI